MTHANVRVVVHASEDRPPVGADGLHPPRVDRVQPVEKDEAQEIVVVQYRHVHGCGARERLGHVVVLKRSRYGLLPLVQQHVELADVAAPLLAGQLLGPDAVEVVVDLALQVCQLYSGAEVVELGLSIDTLYDTVAVFSWEVDI